MCGANKLTGKMELVLLQNEQISLFYYGTFQHCDFMPPTRFVRTLGNGSVVSQNMEPFFHLSTSLLLGL